MDLSAQMILFAKVVESQSFSAAARSLGQTTSAVSRQIGALEDRFKVRLVNRTSTGLTLTDEGKTFYEHCHNLAVSVADAEDLAASINGNPRGPLRLVSTVAFAKSQLFPLFPGFMERFPEVRISVDLTDHMVDLAANGVDVAIFISEQVTSSTQIVRKLANNKRVLVAAPSYVERHGAPSVFADLAAHNCLKLSTIARWNDWWSDSPGDDPPAALDGTFDVSSTDGVYQAALAGIGIARLSTYLVNDDIASGRLVRVLPQYMSAGSDILVAYRDRRNLPPRVREFIDYLVSWFGSVPPWERS